jgi:hypothetical protein
MDIEMQPGMGMKTGHGHAAWKWTCSLEMYTQPGPGHVAWSWTCSMDKDMAVEIHYFKIF